MERHNESFQDSKDNTVNWLSNEWILIIIQISVFVNHSARCQENRMKVNLHPRKLSVRKLTPQGSVVGWEEGTNVSAT